MRFESVVSVAELILEKHRLEQELRTDDITRLGNLRSLKETLVCLEGKSFGVLFLDIDHFKQVNEVHGHLAATNVLKEFGAILNAFCREIPLKAFRYAGDEFVIVAESKTSQELYEIAENFRKLVETHLFQVNGHQGKRCVRITVSAGCRLASSLDRADGILSDADHALYEAKRKSRNTTVSFC